MAERPQKETRKSPNHPFSGANCLFEGGTVLVLGGEGGGEVHCIVVEIFTWPIHMHYKLVWVVISLVIIVLKVKMKVLRRTYQQVT